MKVYQNKYVVKNQYFEPLPYASAGTVARDTGDSLLIIASALSAHSLVKKADISQLSYK